MRLFVCLFCAALLLAAPLLALHSAPAAPPQAAKLMSQRTLNINNWTIYCTNYGPFVKPQAGSGGYWGGSAYNYIYGAGLLVGAIDSSGRRLVDRGYDCASGGFEFGPVNPYTENWENYLADPQARLYLSTDPTDVLEWPLRDPSNRPIIRSFQDSYCKYSDQNPSFIYLGSYSINVVVEQTTNAWNYADNNDIIFVFLRIKNEVDPIVKTPNGVINVTG